LSTTSSSAATVDESSITTDDDLCMVCKQDGNMITCENCERFCHLKCTQPRIYRYPKNGMTWICHICSSSSSSLSSSSSSSASSDQQTITSEELNDMTVKELKSLCKESGFRGYRKMRKEALVGTLRIQKLICININLSVCMCIYIFIDRAAAIRW
jgi:hypothetical protein